VSFTRYLFSVYVEECSQRDKMFYLLKFDIIGQAVMPAEVYLLFDKTLPKP
jgi:hypothetical protein